MKRRKKKLPFDPKAFLLKVSRGRTVSNLRKNQVVYRQGDPANAVFYVQAGKAKVTVISKQGKEAVVAVLGAGDFFGEGCLAGQALRLATVAAMTECECPSICDGRELFSEAGGLHASSATYLRGRKKTPTGQAAPGSAGTWARED